MVYGLVVLRFRAALVALLLLVPALAAGQVPAPEAPAAPAEEPEPRLRGAEIAGVLPRARFAAELPRVRVVPAMQLLYPYQLVGWGGTLEVLPTPWIRLSASYFVGVTATRREHHLSHYADLVAGVRLFQLDGESAVDVPLEHEPTIIRKLIKEREPRKVPIWAPARHLLFVEGGGITATTALDPCEEACVDAGGKPLSRVVRQIVFPAAGFRYVYFFHVQSQRRNLAGRAAQKAFWLHAYAHAFFPPFERPQQPLFFDRAGPVVTSGFGARAGVEGSGISEFCAVANMRCPTVNLSFGYAPYPQRLFFQFQLGYAFY